MNESAGLHIVMDARVRDASVFTRDRLTSLFIKVVSALGMKPLDKVQVYEVPVDPVILARARQTGVFEDEGGISTIQVISTSHLSLHAWPLQKYFALDAFSCKDFDHELALSIIRETLGVHAENTLIIKRRKPTEEVRPGHRGLVRIIEV
jgi:S-adenosylmethionine/arginine decarboxylase-like enzyme